MCTIAILINVVANAPIVVAANRDELYARPTRGPERWRTVNALAVAGGVDVLSGGTWLAVRSDGVFSAVTNQLALAPHATPGLRSRGHAVLELAADDDQEKYIETVDPARYASMNLLWRSWRGVSIAYSRREHGTLNVEKLGRGVHVLCNDRLDAPGFPRAARLRAAIERALAIDRRWVAMIEPLRVALADHTRADLAATPASHLPPELARELTANCIHTTTYGTRSSTLLALGDRVLGYLHADGPPCTTPFVDRMDLLR